jgi:hypothetical protein
VPDPLDVILRLEKSGCQESRTLMPGKFTD